MVLINRKEIYNENKDFLNGNKFKIFLSMLIIGVVSVTLTNIFNANGTNQIGGFIISIFSSTMSGAMAISVLKAYRHENYYYKITGFIENIKNHGLPILVIATLVALINFVVSLVFTSVGLIAPVLSIISGLLSIFVSFLVSSVATISYYVVHDQNEGDPIQSLKDSFQLIKDYLFDIFAINVKYMWLAILLIIALFVGVIILLFPLIEMMIQYSYVPQDVLMAYANESIATILYIFVGFFVVAILVLISMIKLEGAFAILYSKLTDHMEQEIIEDVLVNEVIIDEDISIDEE
ncbi:MAG: hypothetical protein GX760_05130 [Erysipelothrix sp.]|nr:hypothetical protein [Erysipelothrix sp.]